MSVKALRLYDEDGRRVCRMVEQSIDDLDPGNVVIKSEYAAVNYKDARAVTGAGRVVSRYPCVPGVEVAGTVVESADPAFRAGDKVTVQGGRDFGMRRDGAYSEYVRVPAAWIGRIAQGTDPFESVAMGLAAYTSALAVEELINRGVSLVGINGNHPVPERGSAWERMQEGGDLRPRHINAIAYTIAFGDLQSHCEKLIASGVRGRAVVKFA